MGLYELAVLLSRKNTAALKKLADPLVYKALPLPLQVHPPIIPNMISSKSLSPDRLCPEGLPVN
jgi:hypothetical protein